MVLSVVVRKSVSAATSLPLLMEVQLQIKFAKYYHDTVFKNGPNHRLQVGKNPLFFPQLFKCTFKGYNSICMVHWNFKTSGASNQFFSLLK